MMMSQKKGMHLRKVEYIKVMPLSKNQKVI